MTFISIGILLVLFYTLIHRILYFRRIIVGNKLDTIYEEMEMVVIRNNIRPTNNVIEYLEVFKELKVNKEFADIQILLTFRGTVPRKKFEEVKKRREEIIKTLPKELIDLGNSFNNELSKLTFISMFRSKFLLNLMFLIISVILLSIVYVSLVPFKRAFKVLNELLYNEDVIVSANYPLAAG